MKVNDSTPKNPLDLLKASIDAKDQRQASMFSKPIGALQNKTLNRVKLPEPVIEELPTHTANSLPLISKAMADKCHELAWRGGNFVTTAGVVCTTIVSMQSPIKTMLTSLAKNGSFIPPYLGGTMAMFGVLYRGTSKTLSGSAMRTVYVEGSKQAKPHDDNPRMTKAGYMAAISLGELMVTQVPETLSTLDKAQVLPKDFNWKTPHNFSRIMKAGFIPRYASGLVNLSCLCLLSDNIAANLPIADKKLANSISGALSGMVAAIGSYPAAALKDHVIVQTTIKEGQVVSVNEIGVLKDMLVDFGKNPKAAMKKFCAHAAKQLPMRMVQTALIFTIVNGVTEALGHEPLKAVVPGLAPKHAENPSGLFNKAADSSSVVTEKPASITKKY